jgi:hypothetical protein
MTLVDLTGGVGFGFGAVWPSANATSVSTQLPDAVDGVGGGSYAGNIVWSGNHTFNGQLAGTTTGGTLDISATALTIGATDLDGLLDMNAAGSGIAYRLGTIIDANANLSVAVDEYLVIVGPTVPRTFTLLDTSSPIPVDGQRIRVTRTLSTGGANEHIFKRETGAVELGRILGQGTFEFTFHASQNGWYVSAAGDGATITAHT